MMDYVGSLKYTGFGDGDNEFNHPLLLRNRGCHPKTVLEEILL